MSEERPWLDNHGIAPAHLAGKRVEVILNNGMHMGAEPLTPTSPAGWPVPGDGVRGGCNFRLKGPFGIARYRQIGGGPA